MILTEDNKKNIGDSLHKLNEFLDSPAYMDMINNLDTPSETRKLLNAFWSQRNQLVRALLNIYASDIKENNAKFMELISQMKEVRKEAEKAADGLKKIADRIESAVELAKAADAALKIAAGF